MRAVRVLQLLPPLLPARRGLMVLLLLLVVVHTVCWFSRQHVCDSFLLRCFCGV
jgi:hypothetical protein